MKFIGTSTAPILAIANLIAANPCEFLAITAILSPAEMPRAAAYRALISVVDSADAEQLQKRSVLRIHGPQVRA